MKASQDFRLGILVSICRELEKAFSIRATSARRCIFSSRFDGGMQGGR